ncbi:hypothetical protein HMPREF9514_02585 [Enterococcus faecalis TX0855]|nr:hypothetical protein HMPREF9514_02585 [Enterococcus faecalis TX0855]
MAHLFSFHLFYLRNSFRTSQKPSVFLYISRLSMLLLTLEI